MQFIDLTDDAIIYIGRCLHIKDKVMLASVSKQMIELLYPNFIEKQKALVVKEINNIQYDVEGNRSTRNDGKKKVIYFAEEINSLNIDYEPVLKYTYEEYITYRLRNGGFGHNYGNFCYFKTKHDFELWETCLFEDRFFHMHRRGLEGSFYIAVCVCDDSPFQSLVLNNRKIASDLPPWFDESK